MAKKSRRKINQPNNAPANVSSPNTQMGRPDSRRAQRIIQQRQAKRRRIYTMFGGAAAAALILVLVLIAINQDDAGEAADTPVSVQTGPSADIPREGRILGDPDAPVKIVEYGDFQCPGCGQFAVNMKPRLIQEYVATGQASFEYRDFAFLGKESMQASRASYCALEQDKYWEYHDTLFHSQVGENNGAFSDRRLVRMADELGMNVAEFEECLDSDRYEDEVEATTDQGRGEGVDATPYFFINGEPVRGISNYDSLRETIESALQEASS